ncbi:MAG: D-arabinono-1,4-lactone oxidase [Acidimicrobiales bacterium]|jgi:FAD/FMN-containing dehydrogenase|nr:D-arabinono-1,4-lactone oxidase [Acidimicrobiales bacterium]MDP6298642.1 D-arabinono-1,4-lactone oxidase [Acidimicrobiales bacterium]HJM27732.1 D-arabinono-1,4-lactone oxidase [Acidimicrobiales bacterium]HJM98303.1 D-arabinono-1,4-lactone oxidase [Acidimicrobiales bacterium]
MVSTFSNWSGLITSSPETIQSISNLEEAKKAITYAEHNGLTIRTMGSTHSHSPILHNDGGVILTTDNLTGPITIDEKNSTATIPAGMKLSVATQELWDQGFSLINQGDVDVQSIAGLVATGVHGTGITHPSISSQVADVSILTAENKLIQAAQTHEILEAARLNLGVLGIVMEITLTVVPSFYLHEHHWAETSESITGKVDKLVTENDHFEFFWNPINDMAYAKTLNPHEGPSDTLPQTKGQYIDKAHKVFPSERAEKHTEMEYSIPFESGLDCFQNIRTLIQSGNHDIKWPVEYRTVAADTGWISPARDRKTVTISIHQSTTEPHEPFFREAEEIFLTYAGRPHWGKRHYLNREQITSIYDDGWKKFWAIQQKIDPMGLFVNDYMQNLRPE